MNVAMNTALSGLTAASRHMDASASNTANARTSGPLPADGDVGAVQATPASGSPYVPLQAVNTALPTGGVRASLAPMSPALYAEYQPDSPDADAEGMVAAPNVDLAQETTRQMVASAAYTFNAAVVKTTDEMLKSVFDMKA
ncbi:MAG TPA: flagellar basal body rod C-terminal domain-containing protein [Azospirillum sp.]|nr:flagellar basal body rod C-terminal domain-containing protein [Azospirillum sp.]